MIRADSSGHTFCEHCRGIDAARFATVHSTKIVKALFNIVKLSGKTWSTASDATTTAVFNFARSRRS